MPASVLVSLIASVILLPPINSLLLCLLGFLLRRRLPRLGKLLTVLGVTMLVVLSTRAGALLLVRPLENSYPPLAAVGSAQAIVILGAGRLVAATEYGDTDQPSLIGLQRLKYGAYLHRQTGLPVLITGGSPGGWKESEAALMARSLKRDFGIEARWQEPRANTTNDNATLSAAMLRADGIERILLVTDAIHMPRSMSAFGATDLQATAAPMLFTSRGPTRFTDFLPSASALTLSTYAMREWIGRLWYLVQY
ncbi:YdcF family protein [Herbaspirillum sp. alder98]|uniref:YdcF family protein n=1 Tax=Herbaspirillum sp. alder98 TaxID=2913096 RepID=UPI001CD8C09E|nr:YdcF family protein [Herbaspirillum sp. alder98]MCA1323069.1 YdcF family protein [Herbaspirillum sp. alder98]